MRILRGLFCSVLGVAFGSAAALAAGDTNPAILTLQDIQATPWEYHGKSVTLSGVFDECTGLTCQFCDTIEMQIVMPGTGCTHVHFDEAIFPGEVVDEIARFSRVTLEATYDADCAGVPQPSQDLGKVELIITCMDRASELVDARILVVHKRVPVTNGVFSYYGGLGLLPPSNEDAEGILEAFQYADAFGVNELTPDEMFIFIHDREFDAEETALGIDGLGGVCTCRNDQCRAQDWPSMDGHTWVTSPANPYTCLTAARKDGRWRFLLPE